MYTFKNSTGIRGSFKIILWFLPLHLKQKGFIMILRSNPQEVDQNTRNCLFAISLSKYLVFRGSNYMSKSFPFFLWEEFSIDHLNEWGFFKIRRGFFEIRRWFFRRDLIQGHGDWTSKSPPVFKLRYNNMNCENIFIYCSIANKNKNIKNRNLYNW